MPSDEEPCRRRGNPKKIPAERKDEFFHHAMRDSPKPIPAKRSFKRGIPVSGVNAGRAALKKAKNW
ncbi:MAG: hypothetical protein J6Y54_05830 [Lentisphaeria bacterium]|nr:hypothetical protein [Lentisphaeria bacterium]